MRWALTVGTVRGIQIRIHLTFLLLIPFAAYYWGIAPRRGWSGALFGIAIIGVVFLLVVLHELAHSLVARHCGVQVREIELSPIGGIAKMDEMPQEPWQELVTALAGPLVNLVSAVPMGLAVLWMVQDGMIHSRTQFLYLLTKPSWQGLLVNVFVCNVLLVLFNLFPAFPMDGGRALRSILAWRMGQTRGTLWAAYIGQVGAVALGILGVMNVPVGSSPPGANGNVVLILIALALFAAARQQYRTTQLQAVLGDTTVGQVLITTAPTLSPDDHLATAAALMMHGQLAPYAIVQDGNLVGLLCPVDITSALEVYSDEIRVGDIMRKEFSTLSPTDTLSKAHRLMATSGLRALPVRAGEQYVGMVSVQQIQGIQALLTAQAHREQSEQDLAARRKRG
jgi:Zn-dependent protease/predicted transcriptional regulator